MCLLCCSQWKSQLAARAWPPRVIVPTHYPAWRRGLWFWKYVTLSLMDSISESTEFQSCSGWLRSGRPFLNVLIPECPPPAPTVHLTGTPHDVGLIRQLFATSFMTGACLLPFSRLATSAFFRAEKRLCSNTGLDSEGLARRRQRRLSHQCSACLSK